MDGNYTSNGDNMSGKNNNYTPNYQQNNQQYNPNNGYQNNNVPTQRGGNKTPFFSTFAVRFIGALIFIGVMLAGNWVLNETSLFTKTHEIEGVSIDLPRGYGFLDDNALQSGKDDDSFSDDNVGIFVTDNELGMPAMDFAYGYIVYISEDNLEIIDSQEITIDGIDAHYLEYGTNAFWYYEDGSSTEAYCSGIIIAVPNDDCTVIINMYSRRGQKDRSLLSESELDRFIKFADTITLSNDVRSDVSENYVSFGSKSMMLPDSYTSYEPEAEETDFGTNYYIYPNDGIKSIAYFDYSLSPLTDEEKTGYFDSYSDSHIEPVADNGTYQYVKYFGNSSGENYAGVTVLYDDFYLDYYWLCVDEPSDETFQKALDMLDTIK